MERLLSCECGNQIAVANAQAGRQIVCTACGTTLQVPTLRGLSELPLAQVPDGSGRSAEQRAAIEAAQSAWRWRGPAMAACATALLGSLLATGFYLWNWSRVDPSFNVETHIADVHAGFDPLDPSRLSEMWDHNSRRSLRRPEPPPYKLINEWAANNLFRGKIAAGIAAASLAAILLLWLSASAAQRKLNAN